MPDLEEPTTQQEPPTEDELRRFEEMAAQLDAEDEAGVEATEQRQPKKRDGWSVVEEIIAEPLWEEMERVVTLGEGELSAEIAALGFEAEVERAKGRVLREVVVEAMVKAGEKRAMKTNSSRDAPPAEPAWNVLRHNHQYTEEPKKRHKPYATRLGLDLTAFPADNPRWKGDVDKMLGALAPDGVEHSDNDIGYARYCLSRQWRLARVSIADFVSKVAVAWKAVGGLHAPLSDQALATVLKDEYDDKARRGHQELLALLSAGRRFEPVVVINHPQTGQPVIHEGRHRHLAAYDWTRRNLRHDDVYVEVYYPSLSAKGLGLPI